MIHIQIFRFLFQNYKEGMNAIVLSSLMIGTLLYQSIQSLLQQPNPP